MVRSSGCACPPQDSLNTALYGLFRQQLVILLIFWMTIAAPMTCQYHGLLLNGMAGVTVPLVEHIGHHVSHQPGSLSADHHLTPHQMSSGTLLMQSLFLMDMPTVLPLESAEQGQLFIAPQPLLPRQWILPPPEQPPRSSELISVSV